MNRISVITLCFNNPSELAATCASVEAQTLPPFEHWIIDGSTGSSVREWMESRSQPPYRRSIHERDSGIADGFNKGLALATGDVVVFLNSGDNLYDPSVLGRVSDAFAADPPLMWLHGTVHLERGGRWVTVGKPFEKKKLYRGMRSVSHQTMYVRREVFDRHGAFDTSLRFSMDYDFLCRIADEKHTFLAYPLASYDTHGVTSTRYLEAMAEGRRVFRRYYSRPLLQAAWRLRLSVLHHLMQSPLGKALYRIKAGLKLENW